MRRQHYNKFRTAFNKFAGVANEVFREREDSLILLALQKGATYREVGDVLDVSKQAIDMRVRRIHALREKRGEING